MEEVLFVIGGLAVFALAVVIVILLTAWAGQGKHPRQKIS